MNVTHDTKNIQLTTGEIAELFNAYINNSVSLQALSYFVEKAIDPEIKSVLIASLDLTKGFNESITNIFKSVNHPLPKGFTADDVNLKAERLYSDRFMLIYVRFMARFGLTNYSEARGSSTRADVRDFFNKAINSTLEIFNMADDIMLGKGIYIKEPLIPVPDRIDMVENQSFLKGFFGEKRPLNASEMDRLYLNFYRNSLGKAFVIGLIQTSKNKELKEYFIRGKSIAEKQMEKVGFLLRNEDLPTPMLLDSEVTDSTDTVFSDKLMLFHIVALDAIGLSLNGLSLSRVMRRDLSLTFTGFMSEIALYADDGFNMLIANKWFERMPEAADRKELAGV
jgi:hypothetical protein